MSASGITVLHYTVEWGKLTEAWLCQQIASLPESVSSCVCCERISDAGPQPFLRLNALSDVPLWRRVPDKALRRIGFRRYLSFAVRTGRACAAQILHTHFGHVGWRNMDAARRTGIRHVVSFYGTDASRLPFIDRRWLARYNELFARVDRVLCEGPDLAGRVVRLGCTPEKLSIQPLGVPVSGIRHVSRDVSAGERLRILLAATFVEKKGIPDAVAAVGMLRRSGVDVDLTIVGDATQETRSRREKSRILNAVQREGLADRTRFLGYVPKSVLLEEAYRHHIFLAPSRTATDGDAEGGAPVTILEMAATGMPVVSTRHCDIPFIVTDGITGLLAEEGDVSGIYRMLSSLAAERALISRLGNAGRALVERRFDSARLGRQLAEVYRSLL